MALLDLGGLGARRSGEQRALAEVVPESLRLGQRPLEEHGERALVLPVVLLQDEALDALGLEQWMGRQHARGGQCHQVRVLDLGGPAQQVVAGRKRGALIGQRPGARSEQVGDPAGEVVVSLDDLA